MLRLTFLAFLAMLALGSFEAAMGPGSHGFAFAPAAHADDDDDDDDDGGGRRSFRGDDDDDDDRPRRRAPRFTYEFDDDDDDEPVARRAPRRPVQRQARRAQPRSELVAAGVTTEALGRLRAAGFSIISERRLGLLPEATVRVTAPRGLGTALARARLAELAPGALVDLNVLYRPNARESCPAEACFPYRPDDWAVAVCPARGAVGMIDTRVDPAHPALKGRSVEVVSTRGEKRQPSSTGHGTEVAILLAGERGEPDDLKLVAVEAFHRVGGADRADVFDLVAAIDLLVQRGAGVINLSLAGPANALLDRAGAVAAERGAILVAAVGNEGPKAKPLYPAAYPWAVGVTAVDARGRVYAKAGRGEHVAFAAPGVRIELPDAAMGPGRQRSGTSYAAPIVSAALSSLRSQIAGGSTKTAIEALAAHVEDKGDPGRDATFGWGAITNGGGCPKVAMMGQR